MSGMIYFEMFGAAWLIMFMAWMHGYAVGRMKGAADD